MLNKYGKTIVKIKKINILVLKCKFIEKMDEFEHLNMWMGEINRYWF